MGRLTIFERILAILLILLGLADFFFYKKLFRFGSYIDSKVLPFSNDRPWVSIFIKWRIRIVGLFVAVAGIFILIKSW